jgi:hypothetical protein
MAYSRDAAATADAERAGMDALIQAKQAAFAAGRQYGAVARSSRRQFSALALSAVTTGIVTAFAAGLEAERTRE